jgi:hypothetical protein
MYVRNNMRIYYLFLCGCVFCNKYHFYSLFMLYLVNMYDRERHKYTDTHTHTHTNMQAILIVPGTFLEKMDS